TRQQIIDEAVQKVVNSIDTDGDGIPDVKDKTPVPSKFDWGSFLAMNAKYFLSGLLVISIVILIILSYLYFGKREKATASYFRGREIPPHERRGYIPSPERKKRLFDRFRKTTKPKERKYRREPIPRRESVYKRPKREERPPIVEKIEYKAPATRKEKIKRVSRCGECPHYQMRNERYGYCTLLNGSTTRNHIVCSEVKTK
ncbi:MAG: hypothetical protein ACE5K0_01325, partial [Candidatus Methanofastidiosia archaeon]